jgi:hypothetical protein
MGIHREPQTALDRRTLLKGVAAAGLASALEPLAGALAVPAPARPDLIRAENEKRGTTDWLLTNTRTDPKMKYRCPWIEGYCSHRLLLRLGPLKGKPQPDPEEGKERLRECRWEPATKLVIPRDWPSGVYLGKLTAERGKLQSYVIFVVRDDRACDFLFQCSDTTWSAYNRWPDQWSLYDDGRKQWYWGPGVRVSRAGSAQVRGESLPRASRRPPTAPRPI